MVEVQHFVRHWDPPGGEARPIRVEIVDDEVQYTFADLDDNENPPLKALCDSRSNMRYFFGLFRLFPIEYPHHDRINARVIGGSSKELMEESHAGRPQLHVSLAWWPAVNDGSGSLKVFDGQHKPAAQILLGTKNLPVRVFVDPDLKVLQADTNTGDKLKQVAFDMAAKRHLGSTPLSSSMTSDPGNGRKGSRAARFRILRLRSELASSLKNPTGDERQPG
jgi:hypothetical protein